MKVKVVGWGIYGDMEFNGSMRSDAADAAVIDCIKKNGYLFNAPLHQSEDVPCAPIMSDGTMYRCNARSFGILMAMAHGVEEKYAVPHFVNHIPSDKEKLPAHRMCAEECIEVCAALPEDCSESFVIDSRLTPFIIEGDKLYMIDDPSLRYAARGDTVTVDGCSFTVRKASRKKDLTKEEEREIDRIVFDPQNARERKEALQKYRSAPMILTLELDIPEND